MAEDSGIDAKRLRTEKWAKNTKMKSRNAEIFLIERLQREKEQYILENEELYTQLEEQKKELEQLAEEITLLEQELSVNDLCELMKATADVQGQWEELGIALGLDQTVISTISRTYPSNLQCHYEMMRNWIKSETVLASWGAVVCAMRSMLLEEEKLAETIAEKYLGQDRKPFSTLYIVTQDEKPLTVDNLQDLLKALSTFNASWKVLGLMLNMSDSFLESIDHSLPKDCPQQTAFCENWIKSGQAYWSILVDTLKSPLLGEEELAEEINADYLRNVARQVNGDKFNQLSIDEDLLKQNLLTVSDEDLNLMKEKIKKKFMSKQSAQGIVFVITACSPDDADPNVTKIVSSTFGNDLGFAVFSENIPTCASMACLAKAAAKVKYPPKYKYIAFYFIGYGGVDDHDHPFIQPKAGAEKLYIENNILSHFDTKKNRPRCLLFFDCFFRDITYNPSIQSADSSIELSGPVIPVFKLKAPVKCFVAYAATTTCCKLQGEKINIGLWTRHLCEKLKLKLSLSNVLDQTYDVIVSEYSQPPHYDSDLGSVYLKGMPPLNSDSAKSNALTQYRGEFITSFDFDKDGSIDLCSFARVLLHQEVIDAQTKNNVYSKRNAEGAGILFDDLEKKLDEKPELLQDLLDIMAKEECLSEIVNKIRSDSDIGEDEIILKKPPQKHYVFSLLRRKSASLDDFARELRIDDNERKKLQTDISISVDGKLEKVLDIWIQCRTSEVTWKKIIQVLEDLRSIDIAKEVKQFLQHEKHRMEINNNYSVPTPQVLAPAAEGPIVPKPKTICGMSVLSAVLLGILAVVVIAFLLTQQVFTFFTLVYFLQ